jgi:hypothetical protein
MITNCAPELSSGKKTHSGSSTPRPRLLDPARQVQTSVTLYPNNEIRIRVATEVADRTRDDETTRILGFNGKRLQDGIHLDSPLIPLVNRNQHGYIRGDRIWHKLQSDDLTDDQRLALELQLRTGDGLIEGWGKQPRHRQFRHESRRNLLRVAGVIDSDPDYRHTLAGVGSFSDLARVGKPKAIMLTGTLPGSTQDAIAALARWSGYAVNRLSTWLNDQGDHVRLWVWELQKRGALHWHCITASKDSAVLERVQAGFHQQWINILQDIATMSGVDVFARSDARGGGSWKDSPDKVQTDVTPLDKTAVGYLASYQKKGKVLDDAVCPSRWSGCSRSLTQDCRAMTRSHYVPAVGDRQGVELFNFARDYLESNDITVWSYQDKYKDGLNLVAYLPRDDFDHFAVIASVFPQRMERDQDDGLTLFTPQYCSINADRRQQEMNAAREYELECLDAAWETYHEHNTTALERMAARKKSIRQQRKDYGLPD